MANAIRVPRVWMRWHSIASTKVKEADHEAALLPNDILLLRPCEFGGGAFHPAVGASRSVEISAIRPAIASGECFTYFHQGTYERNTGGKETYDHRRADRGRIP